MACSRQIATDATGDVAYAAWMACNGGPAVPRWKKYTTANGWDANATDIQAGGQVDAAGTPPFEQIGLIPGDGAVLVYRRNHNADNAVLAVRLP
jgi:hypothetical protein